MVFYVIAIICTLAANLLSAIVLYQLALPFVILRGRWRKVLLFCALGGASSMVIWLSDPNLLYTLPFFTAAFLLATRGDRLGRLALAMIFFCLIMATCALTDTYIAYPMREMPWDLSYVLARVVRLLVYALIWILLARFFPSTPPTLSRPLWSLVLALAAMPLCALCAVVLLTYSHTGNDPATSMSLRLGIVVLPFVLATALVLLAAILVLARQERLERENALALQREVYYENLKAQDQQLRHLRHDLRNHISTAAGLLERGLTADAQRYLAELSESKGLASPVRYCDNEAANVVLAAQASALADAGMVADFSAQLPQDLPIAAADLCALLGNALDNAREGATGAPSPTITLRLRYDKGLVMLAVDNPIGHAIFDDLRTTKHDSAHHGIGLASMKQVVERYGGTLETTVDDKGFHLIACLSPQNR
ncbi:MAG: GHKL domain-containing protein [Peptococcaceae bacterium]|nr:GHKL domain-containing protein [Peptococcaceae bacterium]